MMIQQFAEVQRRPVVLHEGTLKAEYTVVRSAATRDWVAVGSVRNTALPSLQPAWLLVGTGKTSDAAVDDLRQRLAQEAHQRSRAR